MYRGKNPKALLTIRLILQGFMEELQNKAYEDICITGLCQRADVSRQAFYNIFQTKEEVLRRCIDRIFEDIRMKRTENGNVDSRESIYIFVETFYRYRDFMELIIQNHLEKILTEEFVFAISGLAEQEGEGMEPFMDYQAAFYAGGLTQVLIHWMNDENRISPEELIELLHHEIGLPYFSERK